MSAIVWVTWTAPGYHHWPGANATADRLYLSLRHRHQFGFRVAIEVQDDDREVEFHDLLEHCRAFTARHEEGDSWAGASCEAIARLVAAHVEARWPGRHPVVTVDEDGECGATVTAP
jgi:hypothetical protein